MNTPAAPEARPVAYVITSLSMGGAQKVLLGLLDSDLRTGYPPLVISLLKVPGLEAAFHALEVELIYIELNHPWQALGNIRYALQRLKQQDVRLIYSMMHHANLFAVLLRSLLPGTTRQMGRMAQKPALVWGLHDTPLKHLYTRWTHRLLLWLTCRLSSIPAAIVLVSARSRERYLQLGYPAGSLQLVPNGVLVPAQNEEHSRLARETIRAELGLPAYSQLLGSLTRDVPEKDIPGMLAAFAQAVDQHPALHLLLAGEGMDTTNPVLTQLIERYHLQGRVHLLGLRQDAQTLIRALDVATLSSRSEAFPLFIAEAMALGIPCVATDVGDIALLLGGHGGLVPAGDPTALANSWLAMLALTASDRATLVGAARQRVLAEFSHEKVIQQHAALFSTLLQ